MYHLLNNNDHDDDDNNNDRKVDKYSERIEMSISYFIIDENFICNSPVRMTTAKQAPSTTKEPLKMIFLASNAFGSEAITLLSTGSDSPVIIA